ncbi:MAG: S1 RNA-binding domain-containing protein [Turicibacter sp.]|nr:S1 RNA-binding domain-containing protein [Turicibacter sp.]
MIDVNDKIENVDVNVDNGIMVGHIYTGKVLKIKPFGAIISLPESNPGLVHISQIASGYVKRVDDVLDIGLEVNVRVLSKDDNTGKIALSMKDVPQVERDDDFDDYEDEDEDDYYPLPPLASSTPNAAFEEKFKAWQKVSNERIAGINKRNKRR